MGTEDTGITKEQLRLFSEQQQFVAGMVSNHPYFFAVTSECEGRLDVVERDRRSGARSRGNHGWLERRADFLRIVANNIVRCVQSLALVPLNSPLWYVPSQGMYGARLLFCFCKNK
jgi:hypothetical protein